MKKKKKEYGIMGLVVSGFLFAVLYLIAASLF